MRLDVHSIRDYGSVTIFNIKDYLINDTIKKQRQGDKKAFAAVFVIHYNRHLQSVFYIVLTNLFII